MKRIAALLALVCVLVVAFEYGVLTQGGPVRQLAPGVYSRQGDKDVRLPANTSSVVRTPSNSVVLRLFSIQSPQALMSFALHGDAPWHIGLAFAQRDLEHAQVAVRAHVVDVDAIR